MKPGDRVVLRAATVVQVLGHDQVRVRIDGDAPVGRPDQNPAFDVFMGGIRYVIPADRHDAPVDMAPLPMFPDTHQ